MARSRACRRLGDVDAGDDSALTSEWNGDVARTGGDVQQVRGERMARKLIKASGLAKMVLATMPESWAIHVGRMESSIWWMGGLEGFMSILRLPV